MEEIQKKYELLLQYQEDLKNLLLYVAGPHYEKYNEEWIFKAQERVEYLREEPGLPFEILDLIYDYEEKNNLSEEESKILSKYYSDAIIIKRKKLDWLNAVNLILRDSV